MKRYEYRSFDLPDHEALANDSVVNDDLNWLAGMGWRVVAVVPYPGVRIHWALLERRIVPDAKAKAAKREALIAAGYASLASS